MAKNANIRFNDANVAYVSVDTDTHALTGGVMDETTGTFYPVGGGGESYLNPKITLTVTSKPASPFTLAITNLILIRDDMLIPCLTGASGLSFENETYEGYTISTLDEENPIYFGSLKFEGATVTYEIVTDNCTYNDSETGTIYFLITDPTQDASATLTFTAA